MFPFIFYYNEKEIEIVQHYKYLGVVFSSTGSFAKARIYLYNRALKAYFKLKGIFENILPSIDTSLHVFDHTVKPILLYGCEVWGTSNLNSASIRNETMFKVEKSFENFQSEKVAMKFYKYILGTHKKTTNLPIMGDLGSTPYFIDIICAIIKYFKRIKSLEKDSLLYKMFNTSKQISVDSSDCWFSFVTSIFKELKLSSSLSITKIKSVLITRYMKYWERKIRKNAIDKRGKLRTYYTFKPFFKKEPYLSEIKSREERICLTQFRLSSHQLEIERGRYKKSQRS